MKKTDKKIMSPIAVILLLIVAFGVLWSVTGCSVQTGNGSSETETAALPSVILPELKDEVYLCTDPAQRYYQGELSLNDAAREADGSPYAPFMFTYTIPEDATAQLELDGNSYTLDPNSSELTIDNLMTGKTYPYSVSVTENGATEVFDGSFTTAATNRFIYLPGVFNTRDIGGYGTSYGKKVRQGLLIRGTEIDGDVEKDYFLTDPSAAEPFHFAYDLDLRKGTFDSSADYQSRLGENVRHEFYDSPMYEEIFGSRGKRNLLKIFTALADENNYPMYLHCTYGADRTGTIVYLLQGLLGVSDEDKESEYRLTGFERRGYLLSKQLKEIPDGLEEYKGDTINEKIESFLVDEVGVSEDQIGTIRDIYLEK